MAFKPLHTVVAVVGIATASGLAWWYQNRATPPVADAATRSARPAGASASAAGTARPPAVEIARVETTRITDDAQAVGSLRSRQSVMLRPEVSGRVVQLNFRDGDRVRKGQLLVQLDDQLPQAQVKQAEAELSIARANHRRNQELVAQNFISQRSLDESAANLQVAEAKLALARATLARLRIVAPFDGIAGIRGVNVGDYLKDGADIVNIEDLDVLHVDFRLPERYQTRVRTGQTALVDLDAMPGRRYAAVIQAIDPLVDANGRSVGIRGCIDNRHLQLRPGMFARVTPVFGVREEARVVPEEAIVPQAGRQFVIRLADGPDQDTRIAQRVEVKVGVRQPGRVEIVEGLQAGDTVVVAGQQRIQKDGMPVRVVDLAKTARPGASGAGGPSGPNGRAPGVSAPAVEIVQASGTGPCGAVSLPAAAGKPARASGGASAPKRPVEPPAAAGRSARTPAGA